VVSDGLWEGRCGPYCNEVDPAHYEYDDASRDHHTPERKAERLLANSFLVEVAEHVDTENDHCKCQSNEAVGRTEKWPVAGEEGAEERELRGQKKHYVVCQQGALLLVVPRYLLLVIAVST
jgi:hypothetical protein